jgi:hypothetical protein
MKINILYIQKKQVKAVRVKVGKKTASLKKSQDFSLADQSLDEIFSVVKKSLGQSIRILLSPNLFSLYTFTLPSKTEKLKSAIAEKLSSLTGEKALDLAWDFQEIGQTSDEKILQVIALQKDLLDKIINTAKAEDLEVEALEPLAYSLACLTEDEKPHLLLYPQGKKIVALILEKRKVLQSVLADKPEQIEKVLAFVKDKFKLEVNKVVLGEEVAADFKTFCNQKDMEIKTQDFNPIFGLALEKKSLLTILPKKEETMSEDKAIGNPGASSLRGDFGPIEERQPKKPKGKKIFFLFFLLLLVGGGILGIRKLPVFQPQPSPSPSPTPEPVEEEVIEEPELERVNLKLQVLNGSGEKGVAGEAQEYLEGLGYEDIKIGNAKEFDYEETQIEIKSEKEEYLKMLRQDLEGEYTLADDTATLDEDSDFDAIVIIGKE